MDKDEIPFFTKEEISWHNTPEDNWMCINGLVYNFTGFENEHPGGKDCKFFLFSVSCFKQFRLSKLTRGRDHNVRGA